MLQDLLKPISETTPCGEDCSHEAEFEKAKEEVEKFSGIDFSVIEENCLKILQEKSKDLRSLGFLALAVSQTKGLAAMAEVCQAYESWMVQHWAAVHPQREKARANTISWLNGERVVALIQGAAAGPNDYETLLAGFEALERLKVFVQEKFPENPPSFGDFSKVLKSAVEKFKPVPVQSYEENRSNSSSSSASTNNPAEPGSISSFSDCETWIQKVSQFLLEQKQSDALAYRLLRMVKWEPLNLLPPNEGGKSPLPSPDAEVRKAFASMYQSQSWTDLVKSGEEAFTRDDMLFWFDLQRYSCVALLSLGGEYANCAKAVMLELGVLLKRLPQLAALQFEDGTPFADAMTRDWLQNEVRSAMGSGGGAASIKKKGDLGEEQKKSEALLAEGKLEEALQVLRTGLANDSSEKNNFERKLVIGELCFKANKAAVAKGVLSELIEKIEAYRLSTWDPELCVNTLVLYHKCLMAEMESLDDEVEKAQSKRSIFETVAKISRLDPVTALASSL